MKISFVSSSISTNYNAYYYEITWTITGSDNGLSLLYIILFASYIFKTAYSSNAFAPKP